MADSNSSHSENLMRALLMQKLQNPTWQAEQEQEYDRIVDNDMRIPIILDTRLPSYSEFVDLDIGNLTNFQFDTPTTIEGLWLDRWQRSAAAYTITRLPDDTVSLEYPEGSKYVYRVMGDDQNGFTWLAEEWNLVGRRINSKRTTDLYDSFEDALFEMNKAALSEFEDLTNEM